MPEINPYRELYDSFRESLKRIDGKKLRQAVQAERGDYAVCERHELLCRAAIRCLGEESTGAKNIRNTFFKDDGSFKENFARALKTFFKQFIINERSFDFTDDQYQRIAEFFGHQAEFAADGDAGSGVYVSVLQKLLWKWWEKCKDTFDARDRGGCINWFTRNLRAFDLAAKLSESARVDLGRDLELPPPGLGKALKNAIILNRIIGAVINEINWENAGGVVGQVQAVRTRIETDYFGPSATLWKDHDEVNIELAMDVLLSNDAPFVQWEVACAAAGLVEFEWNPNGNGQ